MSLSVISYLSQKFIGRRLPFSSGGGKHSAFENPDAALTARKQTKMNNFMKDRYGVDDLTTALGGTGMVVALIGSIAQISWVQWLSIVVVLVAVLRALSKDFSARQKENDAFQNLIAKVKGIANGSAASQGSSRSQSSGFRSSRTGRAGSRGAAQSAAFADLKRQAKTARTMWKGRKTKAFLKCPTCGTMLSVPKGKGKLIVTCPKCHSKMETRS